LGFNVITVTANNLYIYI